MAGFETSEWIAQPPEQVFGFLHDPDRAGQVVPSVIKLEKVTDGPVGVGTRFRETRLVRGDEHETELEVVQYEPPRAYGVRNVTNGIETVYTYRLAPEGGGTQITLQAEVKAGGLKAMMVPVVVSVLKREDGDHLQRLKTAVENG
jgi:carbon monoxide dehydrogenase subunit G